MTVGYNSAPLGLDTMLKRFFEDGSKDFKPIYTQFVGMETTKKKWEEYASTAGIGVAALTPSTEAVNYDNGMRQLFNQKIHVLKYTIGMKVDMDFEKDDQMFHVTERVARELKKAHLMSREIRGHQLLNNAFSSSYVGADGVALISASHPNAIGGTWSNRPSSYVDLSELALENAFIDLGNITDNRGLRTLNLTGKKLVVNHAQEFEAARILKGTERYATMDRDVNAMKVLNKGLEVIVSPFITDTDAFYVITSADPKEGLIHLMREDMRFGAEPEFDTEVMKYKACARDAFFWNESRCIYASQGA